MTSTWLLIGFCTFGVTWRSVNAERALELEKNHKAVQQCPVNVTKLPKTAVLSSSEIQSVRADLHGLPWQESSAPAGTAIFTSSFSSHLQEGRHMLKQHQATLPATKETLQQGAMSSLDNMQVVHKARLQTLGTHANSTSEVTTGKYDCDKLILGAEKSRGSGYRTYDCQCKSGEIIASLPGEDNKLCKQEFLGAADMFSSAAFDEVPEERLPACLCSPNDNSHCSAKVSGSMGRNSAGTLAAKLGRRLWSGGAAFDCFCPSSMRIVCNKPFDPAKVDGEYFASTTFDGEGCSCRFNSFSLPPPKRESAKLEWLDIRPDNKAAEPCSGEPLAKFTLGIKFHRANTIQMHAKGYHLGGLANAALTYLDSFVPIDVMSLENRVISMAVPKALRAMADFFIRGYIGPEMIHTKHAGEYGLIMLGIQVCGIVDPKRFAVCTAGYSEAESGTVAKAVGNLNFLNGVTKAWGSIFGTQDVTEIILTKLTTKILPKINKKIKDNEWADAHVHLFEGLVSEVSETTEADWWNDLERSQPYFAEPVPDTTIYPEYCKLPKYCSLATEKTRKAMDVYFADTGSAFSEADQRYWKAVQEMDSKEVESAFMTVEDVEAAAPFVC